MKWNIFVVLQVICGLVMVEAQGLTLHAPDTAEMITIDNDVQVWNYRTDYAYAELPGPLQGLPGVRFAGDTSSTSLETDFVEIELDTSSDVYIFWWSDYDYPDWLSDTFTETEWQCLMGGYTFNILQARLEAGIHELGMTGDNNWRDWYSLAVAPVDNGGMEPLSVELLQTPTMPMEGDEVTLIAEVWNPIGTVNFAWYHDDILLEEVTGSMHTISPVTSEMAGNYRVEVSDDEAMAQDTIQLTIHEALPLATPITVILLVLLMALAIGLELSKMRKRV